MQSRWPVASPTKVTLQWYLRGRSTSVLARGDVCAGRGLLQRLRRLQYLLGVARHLHLPPNAADHALVVDQEGGTLDAQVFLPIHALLHPGAVGLANFAAFIGGEREGKVEFLLELVVARDRVARDADD